MGCSAASSSLTWHRSDGCQVRSQGRWGQEGWRLLLPIWVRDPAESDPLSLLEKKEKGKNKERKEGRKERVRREREREREKTTKSL